MKPLYVKGGATRVELDGSALKVGQASRADCWFPLRRVSRVISATRVTWTTEALLACARNGISISFLEDDGTVAARVVGQPGEREEIRQRLADLQTRPGWREDFAQWLTGMERMACRRVARRARLPLDERCTPRELRRALRASAAAAGLLEAHEAAGRAVHGLLTGFVTQQLSEAGIGPELAGWTELDLTGGLTRVLFWDFRLARLAWLERRQRQGLPLPPPDFDTAVFFEERHERTGHLCQGLINRLHLWLIEPARWH